MLELAAPPNPIAGGQLDLVHDLLLGVGDERTEVAASHIRGHHSPALAVLAADQIGTGRQINLGEF